MLLLDTDHFTVYANSHHTGSQELRARIHSANQPAQLPIVTVEEQLRGWLARIHGSRDGAQRLDAYDRLWNLLIVLRRWRISRWDEAAEKQFASFRKQKVRVPTQDLKIASLAVAHDALLLTRNVKDFARVPGLRFESWLD